MQQVGRKGEFGSEWWARRWLQTLESLGWASRLQRGRSYARAGRVLEIGVTPGQVTARVQGSRPRPYTVRISVRPLTDEQWERVLDALSERASFAARLLAGEMPRDIEEAFRAARCNLFPASSRQISTSCSCPDWANPCKHIAAVYYLLGREFDSDPFLMFVLRGRTREQVLAALRDRRTRQARSLAGGSAGRRGPTLGAADPATILHAGEGPAASAGADIARFFYSGQDVEGCPINPRPPEVPGAVLRLLGPLHVARGSRVRSLSASGHARAAPRTPHPDAAVPDPVAGWLAQYYRVVSVRALSELSRGQ